MGRLRGVSLAVSNRQSFVNEARWQRVCAVCGSTGSFQAHHVVYEQHLRSDRLPKYTTLNALRICATGAGTCHGDHHSGKRRIKVSELTEANLLYAFAIYGAYAADYLRRYYHDDADPRLVGMLNEIERAA